MHWFAGLDEGQKSAVIVRQLRTEYTYARSRVPFYAELYRSKGVAELDLSSTFDFQRLPVVSKTDLQGVPLQDRTAAVGGRRLVNTGGSSGQPLHFFLDKNAFAREWAHMHWIWEKLGYRPSCCKLTLRGKNLGSQPLRYNAVHNEYIVNAYAPVTEVMGALARICRRQRIEYLHGYPSRIGEFARECGEKYHGVRDALRRTLRGILFGSEFPAPQYRDIAESVFGVPSLSWYGHSEMAALAWEVQPYVYEPLRTYGYCEAVADAAGAYHLVATSFFNDASPFIRYDTGDLIDPVFEGDRLIRFRISEGRVGEFILDAKGQRISLTALIFGRHHRAFEVAAHVQVRQHRQGHAELLVTCRGAELRQDSRLSELFDLRGVAVRFEFRVLREPIRTPAGKVPLLVRDDDTRSA